MKRVSYVASRLFLRPLSPSWPAELRPPSHSLLMQAPFALLIDCYRFHTSTSPWANTSFRPRHTQPTVAAFKRLSPCSAHKATEATAAYSALTRPLHRARRLDSLQSRRDGWRHAFRPWPSAKARRLPDLTRHICCASTCAPALEQRTHIRKTSQ